ncbi:hypothetical protein HaLaN_15119 [Haematococcus lacustris]|uniref:Uncharacterized protein n=1 Tax=Haematococcus lacustris TaxID=44745 RepID=A0A699Z6V7_HAELA|nr:hypothetical protein HaLaN_15119 [Haematococcus lacustris]
MIHSTLLDQPGQMYVPGDNNKKPQTFPSTSLNGAEAAEGHRQALAGPVEETERNNDKIGEMTGKRNVARSSKSLMAQCFGAESRRSAQDHGAPPAPG